ncbi:hypothetical protein GYMLUDRAFT_39588 [Collybiopsis luxurians FD-317 M1]|nr:hypothetical protein GYMLUDRAFT_39588 [Collybiopsis luxurians FD-317 M1]
MISSNAAAKFQVWAAGPLLVLVINLLLYGVYAGLFGVCIHVLRKRKESAYRRMFHFITMSVLFVLATVGTALAIASMAEFLGLSGNFYYDDDTGSDDASTSTSVSAEVAFDGLSTASLIVYILANACADIILLFRLYHIWESRLVVVIPPAFLSVVNTVLGIASITRDEIPSTTKLNMDGSRTLSAFLGMPKIGEALLISCLVVNLFTNVLLTCMIGGRIWWIRQKVTRTMGNDVLFQRYNSALAIFLESGMIYPVVILISLIVVLAVPLVINIFPILIQVVSIAPTLILVRSGLGTSTENSSSMTSKDQDPVSSTMTMVTDSSEQRPLRKNIEEEGEGEEEGEEV